MAEGYVACVGVMTALCTALAGRLRRKTVPWTSKCSLKNNVKRDHRGIEYDGVDYFKLAQVETSAGLFGSQ
jgi:hypothetical protein